MKILGVLQNQWFKDPGRVRMLFENNPAIRRPYLRRTLFAGCRTGTVLRATLGPELCQAIIWEEASKQIGSVSASTFPADVVHLIETIADVKPDVVIAFGKVAGDALALLVYPNQLIRAPHPCARGVDTALHLFEVRNSLTRRGWKVAA